MLIERPDGELIVVTGKTRMGKTGWVAEQVQSCMRLLVWDSKNEWGRKYDCEVVTAWGDLAALMVPPLQVRPQRYAFQCPVTKENFEHWCRFAFLFCKVEQSTLVVEEIADCSTAGAASQEWGELVRKSLEWGPTIYALTNRPQESDKTMLGNATFFHCHAVMFSKDQEYIAKNLLDVPIEQVAALQPLEWIERHQIDRRLVTGKLGTAMPAAADLPPAKRRAAPRSPVKKKPAAKKKPSK